MKIALCFHGQPRTIKRAYEETIFKNLIEPNNITDIFVHTWWRPNWANGVPAQSENRPAYYFTAQNIADIISVYNPKKMLIENDFDYHGYIYKNFINNSEYVAAEKRVIINSYPRLISAYKSICLKNQYEEEQDRTNPITKGEYFEYDAVILARFDLEIRKPLVVSELDLNKLNVPTYAARPFIEDETFPTDDWGVNDQFAIGNKKYMNIYGDLVNHLHEIGKFRPNVSTLGEATIGTYLKMQGVPLYKAWFSADSNVDWQIGRIAF